MTAFVPESYIRT